MGTSLMADGVLEGLRDRVAFPIKASSHWNSTILIVNLIPLGTTHGHCFLGDLSGEGREANPWDVSLHLASVLHCVLMVCVSW